mgnify:CR=1 FL=1
MCAQEEPDRETMRKAVHQIADQSLEWSGQEAELAASYLLSASVIVLTRANVSPLCMFGMVAILLSQVPE